jgi:LuxR family transcriptional regulator, quorum-sensing system regulator BjaR1
MVDAYGQRALDFVEKLHSCTTREAVSEALVEELRWFGFDFVTIFAVPGRGRKLSETIPLNTRPSDYLDHYHRNDYVSKDPVVTEMRRRLAPFSWGDVRQRSLTKAQKSILEEAKGFGAYDGLLIPVMTQSGQFSVVSPCGREPDLTPRARSALELIGIYGQQALQRMIPHHSPKDRLTSRERDVLSWVAVGKTDDEIGEILSIAHSTVTTHVENIKRKMDATRRTYAVVQALRRGELSL